MALATVSKAQQEAYYRLVMPAAQQAAAKAGMPAQVAPLLAAWWSWETHYGTNQTAKANNHAGIKANAKGRDYVAGQYAGYSTIGRFADDFARILSLNAYGYPGVLQAARSAPGDYAAITRAMNASQWAEADYNVSTIVQRATEAAKLAGVVSGGTAGTNFTQATCPACGVSLRLQSQQS